MAHATTNFLYAGLAAAITLGLAAPAHSQDGLAIVQQQCAMCHAIGTTGASPHPSAPPFRRLGTIYDLDKLQETFESGTVLPSHPDMPLFKLDGRTARAVVNYLRSIQE